MKKKLTQITDNDNSVSNLDNNMLQVGLAANQSAQNFRFADYKLRRAPETLRRQKAGLSLFQEFLSLVGIIPEEPLFDSPAGWHYITWGLVDGL